LKDNLQLSKTACHICIGCRNAIKHTDLTTVIPTVSPSVRLKIEHFYKVSIKLAAVLFNICTARNHYRLCGKPYNSEMTEWY